MSIDVGCLFVSPTRHLLRTVYLKWWLEQPHQIQRHEMAQIWEPICASTGTQLQQVFQYEAEENQVKPIDLNGLEPVDITNLDTGLNQLFFVFG